MSYQRVLQKLATDDFITESDGEMVAMWERNHMAYHDGTTDQAYLDAIQEIHQMAMEDSREANLVLDDTAMEIQSYKDMDESMEPAPDEWSRYWHHHPRPCQVLWSQDADVISSSTIPTAGAAAASSISIPKATAEAKSSSTTAKACALKVGAKGSCASPANARPGGAMPATSCISIQTRWFQQATRASHTTKNFQARCSHQPSQASKKQIPNRLGGRGGVDAGHV